MYFLSFSLLFFTIISVLYGTTEIFPRAVARDYGALRGPVTNPYGPSLEKKDIEMILNTEPELGDLLSSPPDN